MSTETLPEHATITPMEILDNFEYVVGRGRLERGTYMSDVEFPQDIGNICGGRRACAVGSLVLAARFELDSGGQYPLEHDPLIDESDRGGEWPNGRRGFMERNPAIGAAYAALNEAAQSYADEHDIDLQRESAPDTYKRYGAMELLFENRRLPGHISELLSYEIGRMHDEGVELKRAWLQEMMLDVIRDARDRLRAKA